MGSSAFMWRPWFYHNPIADLAVRSITEVFQPPCVNVQQSHGENARFRTEVTIKHGVSAEKATSTLTGRYSETQQAIQI